MNEIRKGIVEKLQSGAKSMMTRYPDIKHDELTAVVIPLCLDEIAEIIEALESNSSTSTKLINDIDECTDRKVKTYKDFCIEAIERGI